ncbi:hybrid sensor histidine kinase/response regulator [Sulfuriflexus mobilis]|uniref:ATP-binding response regulator n=1 Tax=Sulfuriflexus mobilis TaxID=1811807 RepID=UPI000F826DEB|nr:hybrid sensor histidine kinase/response regulator [Sulfuriflexus mobilis]
MKKIIQGLTDFFVPIDAQGGRIYSLDGAIASSGLVNGRMAYIRAEQIRLLYRQAYLMLLANIIIATVLLSFYWQYKTPGVLLSWFAAICILTVLRTVLLWKYYFPRPSIEDSPRWGRYFMTGALFSGCLWGAGGYLLYSSTELYLNSLLLLVIGGMIVGSVTSLASYSQTFILYAVPAITPLIVVLLTDEFTNNQILGLAVIGFLVIQLAYSRNIQRTITDSIELRFENIELLAELEKRAEVDTKLRQAAETANISKSRFLAASSHDLRQPLHALGLFLDALSSSRNDGERKEILEKITNSVDALNTLLTALLDISKLDAGTVDINVCAFYLREITDKLETEFSVQAERKGLVFIYDVDDLLVRTDKLLLNRILRNLLDNAIKYTNEGKVSITARQRQEGVQICIEDSGKGVPEEEHERIFDEYHQLHNPGRDREQGLGLGLAIVRRLCGLLEHELLFDSRLNDGAIFKLMIPAARAEDVEVDIKEAGAGSWMLDGKLVVVIDDEKSILDGMQTVLQGWGCKVVAAESAESVLTMLETTSQTPDMIISDYRLAENKTGIQAIKEIKQVYGETIPGVLITGDTEKDIFKQADRRGYTLLHKPVKPVQLRMVFNQLLHQ